MGKQPLEAVSLLFENILKILAFPDSVDFKILTN